MILLIYHSYYQHHLSSLLISSYDHYFFISVFTVTQHKAISTPLRESYALQGVLLVTIVIIIIIVIIITIIIIIIFIDAVYYERSEVFYPSGSFLHLRGPTRPDRNANQTLISPELLGRLLRNKHHMIAQLFQFYMV